MFCKGKGIFLVENKNKHLFFCTLLNLHYLCTQTQSTQTMKITKEQALKNLKTALRHKEEAVKRSKEQWEKEGIKGQIVLI